MPYSPKVKGVTPLDAGFFTANRRDRLDGIAVLVLVIREPRVFQLSIMLLNQLRRWQPVLFWKHAGPPMRHPLSHTKNRRPLALVYFEYCPDFTEACKRENFFKTGTGRRFIMEKLSA
jgi:hypothetical protein